MKHQPQIRTNAVILYTVTLTDCFPRYRETERSILSSFVFDSEKKTFSHLFYRYSVCLLSKLINNQTFNITLRSWVSEYIKGDVNVFFYHFARFLW